MKNAVPWDIKELDRTSQETHNVYATDPRRLILGMILNFHGDAY
jgi:hypothetical protein